MLELQLITYDSEEYYESLELRNKIMRKPLGFDLRDEDLSYEKDAIMVCAYDNHTMIGVGVMTHDNEMYKVECLCVDFELQKTGVGSKLLVYLEDYAKSHGGTSMSLEARVTAEKFYMKHHYVGSGDTYLHDHAPVPHIAMKKQLVL